MGSTDLPALAEQLHMEVDVLFPVAEVLQLLRFAELSHGDLRLTNAGRRFVAADTDERKALFGKHLVACAPLAAHIKRVLDERSSHHAPMARFKDGLETICPVKKPHRPCVPSSRWRALARSLPTTSHRARSASKTLPRDTCPCSVGSTKRLSIFS